MKAFIEMFTTAWPGILMVAAVAGSIIGWFATKSARLKTAKADERLVETLQANIKAQEELAKTLADSSATKENILLKERADSDERHEKVIAEYRAKTTKLQEEAHKCTIAAGEYKVELAEMRARTDFKPVMEFQQTWYAESQAIHAQMLETIKRTADSWEMVAPVLQEVSAVLKNFGRGTQNVHVTNDAGDPVINNPV